MGIGTYPFIPAIKRRFDNKQLMIIHFISKAGIGMVTQLFADRLASAGIPVFEVRPGIIATDMTEIVHEKYEKLIAEGLTPIQRFGQPADVAKMVVACCSGLLDFTSGQVLNADGGFHLRRL